jgi:ammonia channel protein AmtB
MIRNVGRIDRTLRLLLGLFLLWLGFYKFNGLEGNIVGILTATVSLMPFYMAATGSCFVFRWFRIHSLSDPECKMYGDPYPKK